MQTQKSWSKPALNLYGSVEDITEQTFTKAPGTGDSITFINPDGSSINITNPGGGAVTQLS
ncbi:hypothetical protein IQ243_22545 [Nostocales cyanobacterium LEGE 11386]|nr:hypothetical protein [Nostocales cyanobacterium LEGE 11386]